VRRIDARTVEFTDAERVAADLFEDLLDRGDDTPEAVAKVRQAHPGLDPEFYSYLEF
jgi:hypothetical protein